MEVEEGLDLVRGRRSVKGEGDGAAGRRRAVSFEGKGLRKTRRTEICYPSL